MRTVVAIVRRELGVYFATPTGYVFISLFVFLSAMAAFWQERFFSANLANLDQLNRYFPLILVFFIPAIAMSLWSEERKLGTEDLLLTLPAPDWHIVLGKYFAGVCVYTVSLIFSLSHVAVLSWLGAPDPGLIATTYFGYWLAGCSLLAVAMLASLITDNSTIAFILGALFCAAFVFLDKASALVTGAVGSFLERLSVPEQFRDLASGIVTPNALVYFVILAASALYLNTALLGRRRWQSGEGAPTYPIHYTVRGICLLLILAAATTLASRMRLRIDATSGQIHSLSDSTRQLLAGLDAKSPVFVHAYLSPDVPRSYASARNNLSTTLREIDAVGGEAVHVKIHETLKYTPESREAQERYNIRPARLPVTEEGTQSINEIFLGLAFSSGNQEFVIPFFDRGLPAEYELVRSIRMVSRAKRKRVGVLDTPARLFGGMDFQARRQSQEWSIIAELRKQYEVITVPPDSDYPSDLDAMIAALPGSLTQPQLDRLTQHVKAGKPALVLLDPMPAFNLSLTPTANLTELLTTLGVDWRASQVAWDSYNPHPQLKTLPKEFVFVSKGFHSQEAVTGGLQEVVLLYPGTLTKRSDTANTVTTLMETSKESGTLKLEDLMQTSLGRSASGDELPHLPDGKSRAVAMRVTGKANAIVIADADLIGEQFFELRKQGIENLSFDNVTFVLNAVDELAGDPSFIALRKRRPRHRTLEAVEARTRAFETQRLNDTQQAEAIASQRLKEAQARLDKSVREVESRADLDDAGKQIMIANIQAMENRRLAVARTTIEEEKQRQIEASRADLESAVRGIQNTIKLAAVVLPPLPAIALFIVISIRRMRRERMTIPADRLVQPEAAR